ncbi:MAG: carboxylesterase/lipase family protein [Polyangiaceae bacterium]
MRGSISLLLGVLCLAGCGDDESSAGASGGAAGMGGSAGQAGSSGHAGVSGGGASGGPNELEVNLSAGPVQGAVVDGVRAFRGIPYAKSPVGELRWKSPQPVDSWSTTLDATKPGPQCPQLALLSTSVTGTEDCLTVDVWSPSPAPATPRPVMVWIHGGGFTTGAGSSATFAGGHLVSRGDVVLVDVNYRLGPLGFLAHTALTKEETSHPTSGNYGFEDQVFALQWVRDNVSAFGGDPNDVTVFGQSAGGVATCLHLASPKSAGLFNRVVIQSGPCDLLTKPLADAEKQGADLAAAVSCANPTDVLGCLRGKSPDELLNALPIKSAVVLGNGVTWGPTIDGDVLPQLPSTRIAAGNFNKVSVMTGTNADEGDVFISLGGYASIDDAQYQTLVGEAAGLLGLDGSKVVAQYPSASFPKPADALAEVLTDGGFVCPTRRLARALRQQGQTVYLYHFTRGIPIPLLGGTKVWHGAELPFVFGNESFGFSPAGQDLTLSQNMQEYWTRFASSGDPNASGAIVWPEYDATKDEHLVLDTTIAKDSGLKSSVCDFWDSLN